MMAIGPTIRRAADGVEDFRGDFDRLAALIDASGAGSPTPPYLYSAQLLADYFRYPGSSWSLAPTIYDGAEPVAFAVGLPRRVLLDGVERRLLISTLLHVAPALRSSGYGIVVWSELMQRAAAAGFDGVISYCVAGDGMDRMVLGACRRLGLATLKVATFSYLARSMWLPEPWPDHTPAQPTIGDLVEMATAMPEHAELSRLWTEPEAAWELARHGVVAVKAGSSRGSAVLTGYVMTVADAIRSRCLVVQEILWGSLSDAAERKLLVQALLARAVAAGAQIACVPDLGHSDMNPFLAAGFKATEHRANAYLTSWSEPGPSRPPAGWYLDVI